MKPFGHRHVAKLSELLLHPPGIGEWRFCVDCFRPYWSNIAELGTAWGDAEHYGHQTVPVPRLFKDAAEREKHLREWLNSKDCPF